jgi:hypothetical protein
MKYIGFNIWLPRREKVQIEIYDDESKFLTDISGKNKPFKVEMDCIEGLKLVDDIFYEKLLKTKIKNMNDYKQFIEINNFHEYML